MDVTMTIVLTVRTERGLILLDVLLLQMVILLRVATAIDVRIVVAPMRPEQFLLMI